MATYSSTITYGGVTLNITSITPVKRQRTIKHVIGKSLIESNIIGLGAQQWELNINGIIFGSSVSDLSAKRDALEALDDVDVHDLVDGMHDGSYIIRPESLQFDDNGDSGGLSYRFVMSLVEW